MMIKNPYEVIKQRDGIHGYCQECHGFYALFDNLCAECYLEKNEQVYLDSLRAKQQVLKLKGLSEKKRINLVKRSQKGWSRFNIRTFNVEKN